MELREHRPPRPIDFSSDRERQGGESKNLGVRTTAPIARALLSLSLAMALLFPAPAIAAEETTTTTIPESTTTTVFEDSTTTIPGESTTTTVGSTTTTIPDGTTTTGVEVDEGEAVDPIDGPIESDDPTVEDPLEGPNPDDVEELPLPSIRFPIVGSASYRSTYGEPRDGGTRLHNGTDIFAEKGTPIVAVASGRVVRLGIGEDAGQFVVVRHNDGWSSVYVHLNNDSPGTDNGLARGYGPGVKVGVRVTAGTILGYVGDSGNAEESTPHLHFELHQPDGFRPDPYPALRASSRIRTPSTLATVDYRDVELVNAELLGHHDPDTGFNAGLAVLGHHAFIGTWGNAERCPGTGVRIVDVQDPTKPAQIGVFADHTEFPGTATPAIWVGELANDNYTGAIGVVALADCNNPLIETEPHVVGFALYSLDDPTTPRLLGVHETASGITDLAVSTAGDTLTIAVVVPTITANTPGIYEAITLFDATDPLAPTEISTWHPDPISGTYEADHDPTVLLSGSSVEFDGPSLLRASLRSFGDFVVDVSDPLSPVDVTPILTEWSFPTDFTPESFTPRPGYHGVNQTLNLGSIGRLEAGLSDGATLIDGDTELAVLIPAPAFDPQRWWTAPDGEDEFPLVWDVAVHSGMVFLTDHHSGLWIFELAEALLDTPTPSEIH